MWSMHACVCVLKLKTVAVAVDVECGMFAVQLYRNVYV